MCTAQVTAHTGLSLISGGAPLTLTEGWLAFDQSVGPRGGGTLVSWTGEGFSSARSYACVWRGQDTGKEEEAPLTVVDHENARCASPVWPHADELARVLIRRALPETGGTEDVVHPQASFVPAML